MVYPLGTSSIDEKSLYVHILNLSAPWQVKHFGLDENTGSVTVLSESRVILN